MNNRNNNSNSNSSSRGILNNNSRNSSNRSSRSPDRRYIENSSSRQNLDRSFYDPIPTEERVGQERGNNVRFDFSNLEREINDVREGNNLDEQQMQDQNAQQNQPDFEIDPNVQSHHSVPDYANNELTELKSKIKLLNSNKEFLNSQLEFSNRDLEWQLKQNETQSVLISELRAKLYNLKVNNDYLTKTNKEILEKLHTYESSEYPNIRRQFRSNEKIQTEDYNYQEHNLGREISESSKNLKNTMTSIGKELRESCDNFKSKLESCTCKINNEIFNNLGPKSDFDTKMNFFGTMQTIWEKKMSSDANKKIENDNIRLQREKEILEQEVQSQSAKLSQLKGDQFVTSKIYSTIEYIQNTIVIVWLFGLVKYVMTKN